MTEHQIKLHATRFEKDSGDLQGLVQLKMLGQGYDFPPICVVVPMRPYGSFSEFYQFIGRGIRVLTHPHSPDGSVRASNGWMSSTTPSSASMSTSTPSTAENDMDPITEHVVPEEWGRDGRARRAARHHWPGHRAAPGGVRAV